VVIASAGRTRHHALKVKHVRAILGAVKNFHNPEGWKVHAHEINPGVIYKDAKITASAFPTKHAMESYGYLFDTPDRSVVIASDTSPAEETIKACSGCDVLIHEARAEEM
jgi:ribonuclease BN (tRNA processing enzyme)